MDKGALSARFGRAAGSYDAHASLQLACARSLLEMGPAWPGPAWPGPATLAEPRALDLGCATAPLARAQQSRWPSSRWLGVDLCAPMLAEARARGRTGERFLPLCADAERLPLADASQGLVFSSFALQWCRPGPAMAEVARVLMPGGHLLLAVPLAGSLDELAASWRAADQRVHLNNLPSEQDWIRALASAGLVVEQHQRLKMTEHYPDVSTLVRAFKATGVGHVQQRGTGLTGKNAWRAMVAAYETRRQNAGLPLSWEVVFLVATKRDTRHACTHHATR